MLFDGVNLSKPMPLSVGDRLGPYEILAPIGEGGMGEVYKARDTRLDRIVAIKVSKDQFTDRFEREARLVAALNHPLICQLYDVGPNYLVFEYIDGAPLKGPLPPAEALRIALQIVEALEEAHKNGIIHRDLKPGNILLTTRGVKVLDFGLAKQSREGQKANDETQTSELTRAGGVMGTPAYMAPEQWQGKPADARSDIYAFGCVLYELLTGARPGRERTPVKQAALEAIVRKCLADDPAKRFQSAAELKSALLEASKGGSRVRWYAIAAGVLVLVAAGAAGLFLRRAEAKPKLTDQDVLVVADFDNKTGDAVFDTALKQALAFQLQQSPFLKAMDEAEIQQTMKLSGRPPDARVTGEIARDICIREGQKATLEGSIAALGSKYLIALQAVNCQTGETLAREEAEATGKEHVVDALGRATSSMRAKLGESLSTIQAENRAYQQAVTTSSLEALQAFYMGDEEWTRSGNRQVAIPFYRHATEVDPNFAFAFAVLGAQQFYAGDAVKGKEAIEKAYALKDRVSERERLFIEDQHYNLLGDGQKTREFNELLARRYPRDPIFHSNLAGSYLEAGEPEKALLEAQAAIRNGPRIMAGYGVASFALIDLNRPDDAKAVLQEAISNGFEVPRIHEELLYLGYAEGDAQAQKRETQWLAGHQAEATALRDQANNAAALGRLKQAQELFRKGADLARQHPSDTAPQQFLTEAASADALFGKCAAHGSHGQPIVMAACDAAAAKKFNEQQSANGSVPITGPEACVRALALLADGQAPEAASVFSQMVDRKAANWGPEYPAAQVGLARAAKMMGDTERARKTYEQFFAFWKDADPDIPLLLEARKEYEALK
jgi:tetratricopeptide (TPR) repeat protein/predicted Ser/Thr protein kinase